MVDGQRYSVRMFLSIFYYKSEGALTYLKCCVSEELAVFLGRTPRNRIIDKHANYHEIMIYFFMEYPLLVYFLSFSEQMFGASCCTTTVLSYPTIAVAKMVKSSPKTAINGVDGRK